LESNESLLKVLTVETSRVYNYLLKRHPTEVDLAELSNHLGLKKPTVLHHLEKLKRVDLVEQTVNGYKVKERVKVSIIKGFRREMRNLLIKWVPFLILFSVLASVSGIILFRLDIQIGILCLFLSLVGLIICAREILQNM